MLPPANRMRRSTDFSTVVRCGARARRGVIVVHLLPGQARAGGSGPLVGLIVGKSVGGSVVRHQVSRRLRAQLAPRLDALPAGSSVVVRALPGCAAVSSAQLGTELDAALRRLGAQR